MIQFHAMAEVTAKAGYQVHFLPPELTKTSNTPVTRWRIASRMRGDWLLMLDSDAFPMADTANRLLMAAKADPNDLKKIVAAAAVRPAWPHFAAFGTIQKSGLFCPWRYGIEFGDAEVDATDLCTREVDGSGFHCVLIHRSVFEVIPPPWFTLNVPDVETGVIYGHDYTFCRRAKQLGGIKTYVEFSARVGHYTLRPVTLADNRAAVKFSPVEAQKQRELSVDVEENFHDDEVEHLANFLEPQVDKEQFPIITESEMILPKEAIE
jgi:hypothetical protein